MSTREIVYCPKCGEEKLMEYNGEMTVICPDCGCWFENKGWVLMFDPEQRGYRK
jgi:transcription initiation factor TFIIIB Brf1 subunit/transcription initiation factor TFIIB